jgi:tight adherence protein B
MPLNAWFSALMVFSTVVFGTIAIALFWEATRDWLRRRRTARRLRTMLRPGDLNSAAARELVREEDDKEGLLPSFARSLPGIEAVRGLMRESKLGWSVETFVLMSAGFGAGAGLAVLFLTGSLAFSALGVACGAWLPYAYARRRRTKILKAFEEQLPEAIDLLTRAIRAGHPLSSGIRMVAEEGPPVAAQEFAQTFEEQRYGLPFSDALLGMVDRMDLVDVRIFVIAVLIQREVGGNLAEILDNLAQTIRGRFYIRRQLRVYTAQGRMSAWILTILPIAVGSVIFLLEPDYIMTLFTTTVGIYLLVTAAILQIIGGLWIRRIVNIEI